MSARILAFRNPEEITRRGTLRWLGWWKLPNGSAMELWNLDIPGETQAYTLGRESLIDMGYHVPPPPVPAPGPVYVRKTRRNPRGRGKYRHTRLRRPGAFDPRSFRTVRSGRSRVIVGCPRGKYSPSSRRCRTGTRAQALLRPNPGRPGVPVGSWEFRRFIQGMPTEAHRAFAERYLDHLVMASPSAPDHRKYRLSAKDANQIRKGLAWYAGQAYPNPAPDVGTGAAAADQYVKQLTGQNARLGDFAQLYLMHLKHATPPAPFPKDFGIQEWQAKPIRQHLAQLLGKAFPNPRHRRNDPIPYQWGQLNGREKRVAVEIMATEPDYRMDRIERRSEREFDFEISGQARTGRGSFAGWVPLMGIHRLTTWTSPKIARMTDYPQMVLEGDWSGVRDSDEGNIWSIFNRYVVGPRFPHSPEFRTNEGEEDFPEGDPSEQEPEEEDYVMAHSRGGVSVSQQGGRYLGEFDSRKLAERFIRRRMAVESFFPNVWWISDPGNAHLVKFRGPTKRMIRESGPKPTKTNPPRGGAGIFYPAGKLRGTWYGRHRNGQLYKHKFGPGKKWIRGLPDGTVQMGAHRGRLWNWY